VAKSAAAQSAAGRPGQRGRQRHIGRWKTAGVRPRVLGQHGEHDPARGAGGTRCRHTGERRGLGQGGGGAPKPPSSAWRRRTLARPDVCDPGQEAHRRAVEGQAPGHRHRDPVVPSLQGCPWNERPTLAAEEPVSRGVEWLRYADGLGAPTQVPRCHPNCSGWTLCTESSE
jgi:hypothetical protein